MGANHKDFREQYEASKNNDVEGTRGTIRVGDLMGNPNVQYIDSVAHGKDVMEQKLGASKSTDFGGYGKQDDSLYDSIKKHGVRAPVSIVFPDEKSAVIMGGHHRIAAAHDIDPNMQIPWKKGVPGFPERYDGGLGNCPMCGGKGVDKKDLNRHYDRLDNYGEEFSLSQVKSCHTCSGSGVI